MAKGRSIVTDGVEGQGWSRQFVIESDRADEFVELHESLGNDVRVEPVTPDLVKGEECATCLLDKCDEYVVIYTRPKMNRIVTKDDEVG